MAKITIKEEEIKIRKIPVKPTVVIKSKKKYSRKEKHRSIPISIFK